MPPPSRPRPPARDSAPAAAAPPPKAVPAGPTETGWLPDCVYTGEKFESGLAFFADAVGRIARFSREPADLAKARRLAGQAALPGLVNAHSHAHQRLLRGRAELRARAGADPLQPWRDAHERLLGRLAPEDVFDAARFAFVEMLGAGITCVGEFHRLHHALEAAVDAEPNTIARELLRAARDVGIRLALIDVAIPGGAPARLVNADAARFVRAADELRVHAEKEYPADEVWIAIGLDRLEAATPEYLKTIGAFAHAQRLRLHARLGFSAADNPTARGALARLSELGLVDKRFTAIGAGELADEDVKILGAARAMAVACPTTSRNFGQSSWPVEKLSAASVGIALGTGAQMRTDLLAEARALEYALRVERRQRAVFAADVAPALLHAATVTGARSLGATSGALEVGRPADFFTVNLLDPSIAGAEPGALLANIVFSLERRAIHEVWVGAKQVIANGRHGNQGAIAGRFIEVQRRLWT